MIRLEDEVLYLIITATIALLAVALVFTATVITVHIRHERRDARNAALEDGWEPLLLDALTTGARGFPLRDVVQHADRMHFVHYLVRYARRLRGAEREVIEALAAPHLPEIASRTRHRSAELRARAVQTLTTLGMPAYADHVLRALDDPSPLVAMTAARGLAHRRHSQYAPDVLARIGRFGEWNHRFLSSMLSGMGDAAVPTLRSILAQPDASAHSRSVAAHALAQLRDLQSAGIVVSILTSDTDRELLAAGLSLLAVVGHAGHLPALLPLLESPESWVRAQALDTLARLGSAEDAAVLINALDDPSPWVALRAAYGLQEIGASDELRLHAAEEGVVGSLAREVLSGGAP